MPAAKLAHPDILHMLYSDHHGWLLRWLRARMGSAADAADLMQDTFLRIVAAPDARQTVAGLREPRPYLATIADRVLIDHLRRRRIEQAYLEALAQSPQPLAPSPEARAILLETLCQIDAMLDGLGARVRQAFLLAQLDNLSYAEIASQLGVTVSSVKKYMAKANEHCLVFALEAELQNARA